MKRFLKFYKLGFLVVVAFGFTGCSGVCKKTSYVAKVTKNQNKVLRALRKERTEDEKLQELINKFTVAKEREQRLMLSLDRLIDSNKKIIVAVKGERKAENE